MSSITLTNNLTASLKGVTSLYSYRAKLEVGDLGAVVVVEQKVEDRWYPTGGRWYLSSLLSGGISDAIYIDYGQDWMIDTGMREAIFTAAKIVAQNYKG